MAVEDFWTTRESRRTASDRASAFIWISFWIVCSVGMLFCNKLAIGFFPLPCTLVTLQFLFAAGFVGVIAGDSIHIGSTRDALRWARVIPILTGMVLCSILALQHAPTTLVITMRALSPFTSLPFEMCFPTPIRISAAMIMAMLVSLFGAGLYIVNMNFDDGATLAGIGWAAASNLLAVLYLLFQRFMLADDQDPVDISKTGITMLNNTLGVVPLFLGAALSGELPHVKVAVQGLTLAKLFWVASSCVVGAGISYTGVWVASLISATSFLVLANANKFVIIFLEAFVLRSKTLTVTQIIGASITIFASAAYGKARDALGAAEPEETTESESSAAEDEDVVQLQGQGKK